MEKRSVLYMLDPMPHNSPFDLNMAVDAGYDVIFPINNVELESVRGLIQDAIFSRGPAGVKKTAAFIGGRDLRLARDMMEAARAAMVPPFEISVLVDPSGAFTTAAALVALVEKQLRLQHGLELAGLRGVVFGGTGPVGTATGIIASLAGMNVSIVDHLSIDNALERANEYNALYGVNMHGTHAGSEADKARLLSDADVVFCTARAGVQVLGASVLKDAQQLKVAGDVNAVPPLGIEGISTKDDGVPFHLAVNSPGAVGIGALAIGDIKYQLQHRLLVLMHESDKPCYFDFRQAFEQARSLV